MKSSRNPQIGLTLGLNILGGFFSLLLLGISFFIFPKFFGFFWAFLLMFSILTIWGNWTVFNKNFTVEEIQKLLKEEKR